jgi:hypothetical protein
LLLLAVATRLLAKALAPLDSFEGVDFAVMFAFSLDEASAGEDFES